MRRARLPGWVVVTICAVAVALGGLGVWWWQVTSVVDPINADPVSATAVVISSPSCGGGGGGTSVTLSGGANAVTATLSGCGFRAGQQVDVEYLAGHPDQVRLAGTSRAGSHSALHQLVPALLILAGLVAMLAAVMLARDRRRSRHAAGASAVSVHEISSRMARRHQGPDPQGDPQRDLPRWERRSTRGEGVADAAR